MKWVTVVVFFVVLAVSLNADEKPSRISIATWNVEWFFDHYQGDNASDLAKKQSAPNRDEWNWRVDKVARVIAQMQPTILAMQEVENRKVLLDLTGRLKDQHNLQYRIAFIEGWDRFTEQDVALLYRSGLVEYSFREQTAKMFQSKEFYNLNKHIFGSFEWGSDDDKETLLLLNVHLRARPEGHDLRKKQARLIRHWIGQAVADGQNVVVLGDLNTEELADQIAPDSEMALLLGGETETTEDDLYDLHSFLPVELRETHINSRQYDRILVSRPLLEDAPGRIDLKFSRIRTFERLVAIAGRDENHFENYYQIPRDQRDISDHYPVMAEFEFQ